MVSLSELIELSHEIGKMPDLIQGGGGNVSVKLADGIMAIKASGACLKDVSLDHGLAFINYLDVQQLIGHHSKNIYQQILERKSLGKSRPSLESGFHCLMKTYTIHSHCVYSNLLTCSLEGKNIARKLFPEAVWVPYAPPGDALAQVIAGMMKSNESDLYFLENHGLITTSLDMSEALRLHLSIKEKVKQSFKMADYFDFSVPKDCSSFSKNILFPDQMVFDFESVANTELVKAYFYIQNSMSENLLTPKYLSAAETQFIAMMEAEKFRRGMSK